MILHQAVPHSGVTLLDAMPRSTVLLFTTGLRQVVRYSDDTFHRRDNLQYLFMLLRQHLAMKNHGSIVRDHSDVR